MRGLRRDMVPAALLALAGALYLGVPYEWMAGFPLEPSRSYLSELAARDQQLGPVFRMLDGSAAVLVLVAVILLIRLPAPVPVRIAQAGLAVFAGGTLADVVFPMACATSADAACAAADAAGQLGLGHQIHAITSVIALVGAALAAAATALAARRAAWRVPLWVGVGLLLASTLAITVLSALALGEGTLPAGAGYVQRVQTVLIGALLAVFVPVTAAGRRRRMPDLPGAGGGPQLRSARLAR